MKDLSNFEKFNNIALFVMVKAFDHFPLKIEIHSPVYFEALGINYQHEFEESSDYLQVVKLGNSSMEWLQSEGFIRYASQMNNGSVYGVSLTLKGLTLLGYSMPNQDGETFIKQAKDVLDGSIKQTATDLLAGVFTSAITVGFKTLLS